MSWGDGESLDDVLGEFIESLAVSLDNPAIAVQIPAVRELVKSLNECSAAWQFAEVVRPWVDALEANNG